MRADLVVIDPPRLTFYPSVIQTQESECIKAFGPDRPLNGSCKAMSAGLPRRPISSMISRIGQRCRRPT